MTEISYKIGENRGTDGRYGQSNQTQLGRIYILPHKIRGLVITRVALEANVYLIAGSSLLFEAPLAYSRRFHTKKCGH